MNPIKKSTILAFVLATFCQVIQAQEVETVAGKIITNQLDFETNAGIQNWEAKQGKLSFSNAHYKDGQRSLVWDWSKGAVLEIPALKGLKEAGDIYPGGQPEFYEPSFYPKGRYGGVKMWLYQEKPAQGKMVFQVGSNLQAANKSPKYRFAVNLNFTGWRAVWVNFEEDAKVKNYKGSDEMTSLVIMPDQNLAGNGKLFIDHFALLSFVSNKRHSDLQFENQKLNLRSGDGYEILKPYQAFLNFSYPKQVNTQKLAAESKMIEDRLEFLILGDKSSDWKERNTGIEKNIAGKIKDASNNFEKFNIKKTNGYVNGLPLFGIRDEHLTKEGFDYDVVMQPIAFPLAMDYRLNNNQTAKEKLILTLDYLQDQGFASGSAFGTVDHVIKLNPIANSIFLLRKELKAQNKLQAQVDMLVWHTRLGSMLDIDYTRGENSDKIRGGALAKLITILMMENNAQKQELLQDFKKYMDYVIEISPGYSDTFKSDFSIFHHRGTYLNTYGTNALNTMGLIHWLLNGTAYALSTQSTDNIKQALKKQAEIAFGVDIHYGVSGRFPSNNSSIDKYTLPAFAYMGMSDNTIADTTIANLFNYYYNISEPKNINAMLTPGLTYSGTFGTLNLMVRLHRLAGKNSNHPGNGTTVMPFSGLLAYRNGDAFATVKGYNKYVWDFESGKNENSFGRYLSHGMLVTAQGDAKKGFIGMGMNVSDGFDWAYLPGATTKALPADKMLYVVKGDEKYVEGKHRNFSESVIASGLAQGENGMFALDLRDDVGPDEDKSLFDNTFRAKKSYFFINNEIICLGSNINNADPRYETVTTLFQYKFDAGRNNYFNGKPIGTGLNINQKADGGYFTDQNGLQYIIPKGNQLVLQQAVQSSYNVEADEFNKEKRGYKKAETPYLKAWLTHGSKPQNKSYQYQVLLHTPADKIQSYLTTPTYEVLQKDATAHIIQHKASGIIAYAIFEPNKPLKGILINADAPIMAMFTAQKSCSLLTVANPDLHLPKWNHNMSRMPDEITNGASKGSIVTLTLKGKWYQAKNVPELLEISYKNDNSIIKVYTKDGKSLDIPLQHRTMDHVDTE